MKKSRFLSYALALAALLVGTSVLAQSPGGVATVRSVKGELRSDGTRLAQGARIATARVTSGPGSQAVLLFDDGMQVTLDENSVLRVVNFELPAGRGAGHIVLDLLGGAARVVTGEVVRRDPRQFSLRTTDASLGVYEPAEFTVAVVDGTYVTVTRGSLNVANAGLELGVPANAAAAVRNRGAYPIGIASSQLPPKARAALARLGEIPAARESTAIITPAAPVPAAPVSATAAAPVTRFWLGASAGRSHIDRDAVSKLIDSGTVDESSTGYKLYAGYQLLRYLAAEAAYVDLGKLSYEGTFAGAPITGGRLKLRGFDLSALATLPVGERLRLFAKAGLFFWQAEASDSGGGGFSAKTSGRKPSFGLGASYLVYGPLAVQIEAESFQFGDHHAQLVSAGLAFNF